MEPGTTSALIEGRDPLCFFSALRCHAHELMLVEKDTAFTWSDIKPRVDTAYERLKPYSKQNKRFLVLSPHRDLESIGILLAAFHLHIPVVLRPPSISTQVVEATCGLVIETELFKLHGESCFLTSPRQLRSGSPFVVVFSSGSTGEPKAVLLSRSAALSSVLRTKKHLGDLRRDRWLAALPFTHVGGLSVLLRSLVLRRPAVLVEEGHFDASKVADLITRNQVTLTALVPTMLHRLCMLPHWEGPRALRANLIGGAPMSCELQQKARQKNLIALRTYGMTETFGQVSTQTLQQFRNGSEGSGNPLDGCDIRVQKGRILIQSTSIASGILDGGEEQELECDGDWLLTQDLGTQLASGEIVVQGRRDLAILSGGEVVHLEAIERKYEAAFSDLDIVVVPCRSAEWGACAVIVYTPRRSTFSSSHEITAEKLSDFAHKQLPPPMRPKFFFAADTIPRTTLGKAQRKKLQQWVESRVSEIGS